MDIYDRVKFVRKQNHLTQEEFAKGLGLTRIVISNIELKKVEPKENFLDFVCKIYNVNRDWLYSGVGEPFKEIDDAQKIAAFIGSLVADDGDPFKRRMVSLLADLTPEEWKLLERMAERLTKKEEGSA